MIYERGRQYSAGFGVQIGESLERQNAFSGDVHAAVIAHSFDVNYFAQIDFFEAVFGFDENEIFAATICFSAVITN